MELITARSDSRLQQAGRTAWSIIGITAVVLALGWLAWRLRVVTFPLFLAVLVVATVSPASRWLVRRGMGRGTAAALVVMSIIGALVGAGFLIVPSIVDQLEQLGTQVGESLDRLENWVQRERPFGFDASDIDRLRSGVGSASPDAQQLVDGVRTVGGMLAGLLFTVIAIFFFLRDGNKMVEGAVGLMPSGWHDDARAIVDAIVSSLSGYVQGALVLGIVEGVVTATVVALVGGELAVVLGVITLLGAFVPFVGATVAAALSIGITFATAGTTPGLIVAGVVLVTQQLDNDLLAPVIYGRLLRVHPLAILASIAIGIETAGLIGALVAVPLAASIVGAWRVLAGRRTRSTLAIDQPT